MKLIKNKSKSRPLASSDAIPYYNGDCGAIQIGCQAETAEMVLRFRDCNFRENKAFWHGGALAIQAIKELELLQIVILKHHQVICYLKIISIKRKMEEVELFI